MEFDPAEIAYVPTMGVRRMHETPLVTASDDSLKGYGCLVTDPKAFPIEIVRWPAQGWRPVDGNSGDQGGIAEGIFEFWWKGDTLYAATTRSVTAICSPGAIGRKKRRMSARQNRAGMR